MDEKELVSEITREKLCMFFPYDLPGIFIVSVNSGLYKQRLNASLGEILMHDDDYISNIYNQGLRDLEYLRENPESWMVSVNEKFVDYLGLAYELLHNMYSEDIVLYLNILRKYRLSLDAPMYNERVELPLEELDSCMLEDDFSLLDFLSGLVREKRGARRVVDSVNKGSLEKKIECYYTFPSGVKEVFTKRESEYMYLISNNPGISYEELASIMDISIQTVRVYKSVINLKFGNIIVNNKYRLFVESEDITFNVV